MKWKNKSKKGCIFTHTESILPIDSGLPYGGKTVCPEDNSQGMKFRLLRSQGIRKTGLKFYASIISVLFFLSPALRAKFPPLLKHLLRANQPPFGQSKSMTAVCYVLALIQPSSLLAILPDLLFLRRSIRRVNRSYPG